MTVTFFSNYLNHHQKPLCDELFRLTGGKFRFVANRPISVARLKLGYEDMNQLEYVVRAYDNPEAEALAEKLAHESDIIIQGQAPQKYEDIRIAHGKPFFRFYERLFKNLSPIKFLYVYYLDKKRYGGSRNANAYTLCASAYTAEDMCKVGDYKDKCYKWGYFPKVKRYDDLDALVSRKESRSILWVGRMIGLKHPEFPIEAAERLKAEGYDFNLTMVGAGDMEDSLRETVSRKGLDGCITFTGSMPTDKVREHMEKAAVYLFTSNRSEGWGAVLNESMNSGCAVVASHAIGSVPFLLEDGKNGLIYRDGDKEDFYNKIKYLLDNPEKRENMGREAYRTMTEQWNAENAAQRFLELAEAVLGGDKTPDIFPDGVCSKASILKNNWY